MRAGVWRYGVAGTSLKRAGTSSRRGRYRWNPATARRVYTSMYGGMVCLLLSWAAVAQVPQREPFDAAHQAFWIARNAGHFDEAAAKREEARRLLERTAVDARN